MSKYDRETFRYAVGRILCSIFGRTYLRLKITGKEHIPLKGGCIIASNHVSYLDPPMLGVAAYPRVVRFIARETLSKNRLSEWIMQGMMTILIDRTKGDLKALRSALQSLKQGDAIGLFPEGTRSPDGLLQEPKGGIGFLIGKSGVPVIPAYIKGTYESYPKGCSFPKRVQVSVHFGAPVMPDEIAALGTGKEVYNQAGSLVMSRIRVLQQAHD